MRSGLLQCNNCRVPLNRWGVILCVSLLTGIFTGSNAFAQDFSNLDTQSQIDSTSREAFKNTEEQRALQLGILFDTGIPDGLNLGVTYRPYYWLRAHGGMSHNLVGFGLRGGVSFILLNYQVSPSLVVEGGHFFRTTMTGILSGVIDDGDADEFSYSYGNLHLGLELSFKSFSFYLRGGYSIIDAAIGLDDNRFSSNIRLEEDTQTTIYTPSAKFGLIFYVL